MPFPPPRGARKLEAARRFLESVRELRVARCAMQSVTRQAFQCPDLPPIFSSSRISPMIMPRSTALHMS